MTSAVHSFNFVFAMMAALGAFMSLNKMSGGTSSHAMKATFATLGAGMVGEGLAILFPDWWQASVDTLTFGGVAALLMGSQRVVAVLPERWIQRAVYATLVLTWIVSLAAAGA